MPFGIMAAVPQLEFHRFVVVACSAPKLRQPWLFWPFTFSLVCKHAMLDLFPGCLCHSNHGWKQWRHYGVQSFLCYWHGELQHLSHFYHCNYVFSLFESFVANLKMCLFQCVRQKDSSDTTIPISASSSQPAVLQTSVEQSAQVS